jgi:hypothetical protein
LLGSVLLAAALLRAGLLDRNATPRPYSYESFDAWLAEREANRADFREFERFLASQGVGDVVPAWQLTRSDSQRSAKCERPEFLIAPREKWPNIVPALRLLRDHVKPSLGELEVVSSYRTEAFNGCAGGASRSKHLAFEALDLIAPGSPDQRELFLQLCEIQRELGPASRFGFGAYFDPTRPDRGNGRFHVDASGYRNWGFGYVGATSACRALASQPN